jgi:hypothetical protein
MSLSGQTNNISVDRDSLNNVFSNFQKTKAEVEYLKKENRTMQKIIVEHEGAEIILNNQIDQYRNIIVPSQKEIISKLNLMINDSKKAKRKAYINGGIHGSIGTGAIILFLFLL